MGRKYYFEIFLIIESNFLTFVSTVWASYKSSIDIVKYIQQNKCNKNITTALHNYNLCKRSVENVTFLYGELRQ